MIRENATHQPGRVVKNLARGDTRNAVRARVVRLCEDEVLGVDREGRAAKRERDARVRVARDDEPALAVGLCALDERVDRLRVRGGRDDERGAGVDDAGGRVKEGLSAAAVRDRLVDTPIAAGR